MRVTDLFGLVWTNLWRRKIRTALTTVGVVIETAAIITMVSLGVGVQKNLTEQLSGIGKMTEIEVFSKYKFSAGMTFGGDLPEPVRTLDKAAVEEIREIEGVVAVSPVVMIHNV